MENININILIKKLKKLNIKVTSERYKMLELFIKEPYNHFTPKEIFEYFNNANQNLGLATIYRNLNLFESLNIIDKLVLQNGIAKYEFNNSYFQNKNFHFHLICINCGRIIDYNYEEINNLCLAVEKNINFKVENIDGEFYGGCEVLSVNSFL